MNDELSINITIAGRPYHLTINRKEEEAIRKAVKLIEAQASHYANIYKYKDKQDLLAMVALHFSTAAISAREEALFIKNSFSPALNEIENILTEALKD